MKFFSAFDSNKKYSELADAQKEFGADRVLLITKSKVNYMMGYVLPAIILGLITSGIIRLGWEYRTYMFMKRTMIALVCATVIMLIIIGYKSFIYHNCVFMIITPQKVDIYNQLGLTHSNVKSIFVQEISGVYIDKDGLRQSIIDNGNITIETEENPHTQVYFGPIAHPDRIKKKVENIIEKLVTKAPKKHTS